MELRSEFTEKILSLTFLIKRWEVIRGKTVIHAQANPRRWLLTLWGCWRNSSETGPSSLPPNETAGKGARDRKQLSERAPKMPNDWQSDRSAGANGNFNFSKGSSDICGLWCGCESTLATFCRIEARWAVDCSFLTLTHSFRNSVN